MAQKLVEVLGVINDATGKIEGFVPAKIPGASQSPVSGGGAAVAGVSQYDKVLLMATAARQFNAVAGVGQNAADAQYVGAITPAEVYGTEAGLLSVGTATDGQAHVHLNHGGVCHAANVWRDALIAGNHI